jgi:hypothetical protein
MVLLGLNGGFGTGDIAALPITALNLDRGWLGFARPKTGINRLILLWSETVKAIRDWLEVRPTPRDEADAEFRQFSTLHRVICKLVIGEHCFGNKICPHVQSSRVQRARHPAASSGLRPL